LSQGTAALAAYRARGFVLERRIVLDGWVTLVLARPAGRVSRRRNLPEVVKAGTGSRMVPADWVTS
jgi:hypothetical protein